MRYLWLRHKKEQLIMLPTELDLQVRKEQYKDQIRALEQERLIQFFKHQPGTANRLLFRRVIVWLGVRLVTWGATLQRYGLNSPAHPPTVRVR